MMFRTHLAIALLAVLLILPSVSAKLIFVPVALIAALMPDLDTSNSKIGQNKIFGVLGVFSKHRGLFHSLTFCLIISALFAIFIPVMAFAFFLGYSVHLFCDSFTYEGIRPFWPSKKSSFGIVRTGGKIEKGIFICFLALDVLTLLITIS